MDSAKNSDMFYLVEPFGPPDNVAGTSEGGIDSANLQGDKSGVDEDVVDACLRDAILSFHSCTSRNRP